MVHSCVCCVVLCYIRCCIHCVVLLVHSCVFVCCIVRMYTFVCAVQCINTFFILLLFYVGTHLARGYSLGTHGIITSTYSHNTITGNQIYTHTLCGQWQHFFQVVQGCRAGFEPRTSHSSCSASSLNCH